MNRLTVSFGIAALTTMLAFGSARADEEHGTCDAAFEKSELLLRPSEGKLLDARAALRACALPSCQAWMVDDCTKRLTELERRIPSVVFSAESSRGVPLSDVRVFEGERELVAQIDGHAIEMDPGRHELVAERAGVRASLVVAVIEGKKAQQIVFAFPDPAPEMVPPKQEAPAEAPLANPWARPLAGGLLLGGVVATGLGIGFGVAAIGDKRDARCDDNDVCDGKLDDTRHAARASTVSFVVGGALAVGGVATFLVFGRTRIQASAWLDHVRLGTTW